MADKPVPQDHKTKAEKAKSVAAKRDIDGREVDGFEVTHRGFTVFVQKEAFDDFEFLDDISNLEKQKAQAFPALLRRLVGHDFKIAMDGLRDETTKRVAIEAGVTYVQDVLAAVNPNG